MFLNRVDSLLTENNHIKNIAIIFTSVGELNYNYLVLTRLELKKKKNNFLT